MSRNPLYIEVFTLKISSTQKRTLEKLKNYEQIKRNSNRKL